MRADDDVPLFCEVSREDSSCGSLLFFVSYIYEPCASMVAVAKRAHLHLYMIDRRDTTTFFTCPSGMAMKPVGHPTSTTAHIDDKIKGRPSFFILHSLDSTSTNTIVPPSIKTHYCTYQTNLSTNHLNNMRPLLLCILLKLTAQQARSFSFHNARSSTTSTSALVLSTQPTFLIVSRLQAENDRASSDSETVVDDSQFSVIPFETEEEQAVAVGNLVADDEWAGLSMELSDIIRKAVVEDLKSNARDFLGKDTYQVGDVSKEIDARVKSEVARLRNKDNYELGDFVLAVDEMSKNMTEQLTGKPYETGDLSIELDKRIKRAVAEFCGADEYKFGMLTTEITKRVDERVSDLLGKSYEFGDISRAVENRRKQWVKDFLGDEAAENYQFGDITKKFINGYTGKSEYKFGDLSKKVFGKLFKKDGYDK
jgi:hypothetical protein